MLDRARDLVDRARKELDPLGRLVRAPAGEVRDALAACVEAEGSADDKGDALDDQLGLRAAVRLVVDAVGVGKLVDEGRNPAVSGQFRVDHDPRFAGGAVTRRTVERLVLDCVAERDGVPLKRPEQVGVAGAADRLPGRFERCRLDSGERIGLRDIEDSREPKTDELRFALVGVRLLGATLSVADGGEDPDRFLALADAAAEFEPSAESGDLRCVWSLQRDQQRVAQGYLGSS